MFKEFSDPPKKINMTMETPPFEDVFPLENEIFQCHVSFQGCIFFRTYHGCFFEGFALQANFIMVNVYPSYLAGIGYIGNFSAFDLVTISI